MTLTLQLPVELSEELEEQAGRIGVSPEEHATELLSVAAAVIGEEQAHSTSLSGYRMQLAATMLQMIRLLLADESTSDEEKERLLRLAALLDRWTEGKQPQPVSRPSAFGKYRGIIGSSADYAESKQVEIDREDRRSA
jgi:hypothetical protein